MTNFADRTIWTGDNLDILRGLNSASVVIFLALPIKSGPAQKVALPEALWAVGLGRSGWPGEHPIGVGSRKPSGGRAKPATRKLLRLHRRRACTGRPGGLFLQVRCRERGPRHR